MKGELIINGEVYNGQMAGIPILTDVQINNIINYINQAWGNDYGQSNVKKVSQQLETCEEE
jgi:mono/diheme cytochrome c family protein